MSKEKLSILDVWQKVVYVIGLMSILAFIVLVGVKVNEFTLYTNYKALKNGGQITLVSPDITDVGPASNFDTFQAESVNIKVLLKYLPSDKHDEFYKNIALRGDPIECAKKILYDELPDYLK